MLRFLPDSLRRLAAPLLKPRGEPGAAASPLAGGPTPGAIARYVGMLLLIALVLSFLLFALDPMAKRYEGPSVRRPWDQKDARAGTVQAEQPIVPPWLTWDYYSTFWKHRLAGDIDYSIIISPSQFMRTFGTLMKEGDRRRANTELLFTAAIVLALLGGTVLGWVLRAWRRRLRWRTGFALLELLTNLPVVTVAIFTLLVMARGWDIRPDWRRLAAEGWLPLLEIVIFPAFVLAVPLVPRIARFWLDLPADPLAEGPLAFLWNHGRAAVRAFADAVLLALGWIAVVEIAFVYPGLGDWAVRAISDVRVSQAWLWFVSVIGFVAVCLGGRAVLYSRPAPPEAEPATAPEPAPAATGGALRTPLPAPAEGWFRHLAERDALVIGGYLLLGLAMTFVFAGLFSGMAPENIKELQPYRHATEMFPLGSDMVGRNVWRLLIEGGRVYLPVAAAMAALTLAIGWVLGGLAAWLRPAAAFVRWLSALLSVFPGVWWAMIVVLIYGRGLAYMAAGLVLAALPGVLAAFAPAAPGERPPAWRQTRGRTRAVLLAGLLLMTSVQSFLILIHLAFLSIGERYPGPEWGATLRDMFSRPHPDGVLAVAPALTMLALAVAAFLPGRVMLDRVDRRGWAAAPAVENSD